MMMKMFEQELIEPYIGILERFQPLSSGSYWTRNPN